MLGFVPHPNLWVYGIDQAMDNTIGVATFSSGPWCLWDPIR